MERGVWTLIFAGTAAAGTVYTIATGAFRAWKLRQVTVRAKQERWQFYIGADAEQPWDAAIFYRTDPDRTMIWRQIEVLYPPSASLIKRRRAGGVDANPIWEPDQSTVSRVIQINTPVKPCDDRGLMTGGDISQFWFYISMSSRPCWIFGNSTIVRLRITIEIVSANRRRTKQWLKSQPIRWPTSSLTDSKC